MKAIDDLVADAREREWHERYLKSTWEIAGFILFTFVLFVVSLIVYFFSEWRWALDFSATMVAMAIASFVCWRVMVNNAKRKT